MMSPPALFSGHLCLSHALSALPHLPFLKFPFCWKAQESCTGSLTGAQQVHWMRPGLGRPRALKPRLPPGREALCSAAAPGRCFPHRLGEQQQERNKRNSPQLPAHVLPELRHKAHCWKPTAMKAHETLSGWHWGGSEAHKGLLYSLSAGCGQLLHGSVPPGPTCSSSPRHSCSTPSLEQAEPSFPFRTAHLTPKATEKTHRPQKRRKSPGRGRASPQPPGLRMSCAEAAVPHSELLPHTGEGVAACLFSGKRATGSSAGTTVISTARPGQPRAHGSVSVFILQQLLFQLLQATQDPCAGACWQGWQTALRPEAARPGQGLSVVLLPCVGAAPYQQHRRDCLPHHPESVASRGMVSL